MFYVEALAAFSYANFYKVGIFGKINPNQDIIFNNRKYDATEAGDSIRLR